MTCPICGARATHETYNADWGLEEESITCPTCGYLFEYCYGSYTEILDGHEWYWSWDSFDTPYYQQVKTERQYVSDVARAERGLPLVVHA